MTHTSLAGWLLIAGFIALTVAMAKPFGMWLFALYEGRTPRGLGWLGPVERLFIARAAPMRRASRAGAPMPSHCCYSTSPASFA